MIFLVSTVLGLLLRIYPRKKNTDICMEGAASKRVYTTYTAQDKVGFFKLMFGKILRASVAAKQLGVHVRSV